MIVPGRSREGYVTIFRAKAGPASRDTGAVVVQAINPSRAIATMPPATTTQRFGTLPFLSFMRPFNLPSIRYSSSKLGGGLLAGDGLRTGERRSVPGLGSMLDGVYVPIK